MVTSNWDVVIWADQFGQIHKSTDENVEVML